MPSVIFYQVIKWKYMKRLNESLMKKNLFQLIYFALQFTQPRASKSAITHRFILSLIHVVIVIPCTSFET